MSKFTWPISEQDIKQIRDQLSKCVQIYRTKGSMSEAEYDELLLVRVDDYGNKTYQNQA
jgi:hypothetical protein